MKIAIIGSKKFERYDVFGYYIKKYHIDILANPNEYEIVSRGAVVGTDIMVKSLAKGADIPLTVIKPGYVSTPPTRDQEIADYADCCIAFILSELKEIDDIISNFYNRNKKVTVHFVNDSEVIQELLDDLGYELPTVKERNLKYSAELYGGNIPQPLYHLQGNEERTHFGERVEGGLFYYKEDAERIKQMLPQDISWEITDISIFYEPKEN